MELAEKVSQLPAATGVYLFKDALGKVIYVGKANSLRHRVRSYFAEGRWQDAKTGTLVREAADVETIVVDTENEALALENNLIKQHQPRFNVLLRDDKTYPYLKLTAREQYPRVYVTRRVKKDGSLYFGPYFPARLAYRLAELIHPRLQVRPPPPPSPAMPAVLHQALPRPLRRRAHHRRALRRGRPRRPALPRRPARRPARQPPRPHGASVRGRALRAGRRLPRPPPHRRGSRGKAEARRRCRRRYR